MDGVGVDVEDGTLSDKSGGDELVYRVVVEEEAILVKVLIPLLLILLRVLLRAQSRVQIYLR